MLGKEEEEEEEEAKGAARGIPVSKYSFPTSLLQPLAFLRA
jgi:hypothetical protein